MFKKKKLPKGSFAYATESEERQSRSAASALIAEVIALILVVAGILAALNYLGIFQITKFFEGPSPVKYTNPVEKGQDLSRLAGQQFVGDKTDVTSVVHEIIRSNFSPNIIKATQEKDNIVNGVNFYDSSWNTGADKFFLIIGYNKSSNVATKQLTITLPSPINNLTNSEAGKIIGKYFSIIPGSVFSCTTVSSPEKAQYCESFWEDKVNGVKKGLGVQDKTHANKATLIYCEYHKDFSYERKSCFIDFKDKGI